MYGNRYSENKQLLLRYISLWNVKKKHGDRAFGLTTITRELLASEILFVS
jgi:hypothetical protein